MYLQPEYFFFFYYYTSFCIISSHKFREKFEYLDIGTALTSQKRLANVLRL